MRRVWSLAFVLSALSAGSANAEIIKGVMAIKGAEMSWWGGMAADAVARQYDVEKNRVILVCETDKGQYRPGTITFVPKQGKTIDLRKIEESLRATRLSGGTSMSVDYFEITATGDVMIEGGKSAALKVAGTNQQLVLKAASAKDDSTKDDSKTALQRLCDEVLSGGKIVSVTGRVEGWNGRFPAVLGALARQPADAPMVLVVTAFETGKKWAVSSEWWLTKKAMKDVVRNFLGAVFGAAGAAPTWTAAGILALLGLAGTATATLVMGWLAPVLIAISVLLLGRSFYILYVRRRGTRLSALVTWLSAVFVVGYWTWRFVA